MLWFRFVENPRKLTRVAVAAILVLFLGAGACWAWTFRWLSSGRARLQNGQITLAQQSLQRFVRWHPKHAEAHYLLAMAYGERRDWKSALAELTQVPDDSPQAVSARWREGDIFLQLNRAADAERSLVRALELDPNCLEAIRGLLHLYRWQDRYADAEPLVWRA
jgi:Flp pilus assembly protein TadD